MYVVDESLQSVTSKLLPPLLLHWCPAEAWFTDALLQAE